MPRPEPAGDVLVKVHMLNQISVWLDLSGSIKLALIGIDWEEGLRSTSQALNCEPERQSLACGGRGVAAGLLSWKVQGLLLCNLCTNHRSLAVPKVD